MTSDYIERLKEAAKKRARIIKMRESGKSVIEIANALELSRQRIYDILKAESDRKERAK